MSNETIWVSEPRWPGAETPPATAIWRVMAHWTDSGAPSATDVFGRTNRFYRSSASYLYRAYTSSDRMLTASPYA